MTANTLLTTARADVPQQLLPGSPDLRQAIHPVLGGWTDFRKKLRPDYRRVWRDVIFCVTLMIAAFAFHVLLTRAFGNAFGLKIGVPFAVWIGFWLNSLLTFGHEAAHFNLSSGKARNDLLADWTIWLFFPQTTKTYRRSHWQHHLHLGDTQDTEISYHNCLSPWFLAKTVTGLHLATLLFRYVLRTRSSGPPARHSGSGEHLPSESRGVAVLPLLRTLATHSIFVGIAVAMRSYASAFVWIFAVVLVFPFFASVRQVLEHRMVQAGCATDFSQESHGPINRMFGKDFFSRYFGAAGFNRHLLHHWDPTVSYTRFDDMQLFLAQTGLGPLMERARSTYFGTFSLLLKEANDKR